MCQNTDVSSVGTPLKDWPTEALLSEAKRLEATQRGDFTTALSDPEKRYLDIMAELFARNAMPGGYGCTRRGCGGRWSCSGCAIAKAPDPQLLRAAAQAGWLSARW